MSTTTDRFKTKLWTSSKLKDNKYIHQLVSQSQVKQLLVTTLLYYIINIAYILFMQSQLYTNDVAGCSRTQKQCSETFSNRHHSRSNRSLGLITRFIPRLLTECNHSRLAPMNFHLLLFWPALSLLCDISHVTMTTKLKWELIDCCIMYIMITAVSSLSTRLIHMSLSYWTFYCLFEISLEWKLSNRLEFKSNVLRKYIASKNILSDMNYIFKNT